VGGIEDISRAVYRPLAKVGNRAREAAQTVTRGTKRTYQDMNVYRTLNRRADLILMEKRLHQQVNPPTYGPGLFSNRHRSEGQLPLPESIQYPKLQQPLLDIDGQPGSEPSINAEPGANNYEYPRNR